MHVKVDGGGLRREKVEKRAKYERIET